MEEDLFDPAIAHQLMRRGEVGMREAVAYIHKYNEINVLRILRKFIPWYRQDIAKDLYQEVMLDFLEALLDGGYDFNDERSNPIAFIATIAARRRSDYHRKLKNRVGERRVSVKTDLLDQLVEGFREAGDVFPALADKEYRQHVADAVSKAVAELPEIERLTVQAWLRVRARVSGEQIWGEVLSELRATSPSQQFNRNQAQAAFTRAKKHLLDKLLPLIQG